MKGKLNDWHRNNSSNGWVEGKFIGRHRDYLLDRKASEGQIEMLRMKITVDTEEQGHYTKTSSA